MTIKALDNRLPHLQRHLQTGSGLNCPGAEYAWFNNET